MTQPPMVSPRPSSLQECRPRPVFVHTLTHSGTAHRWFLGFPLDECRFSQNTRLILSFDDNTPRLFSMEHYDHRTSGHYWFELTEIERVRQDIADALANRQWAADEEAESCAQLETLLRLWNTGAI